MGKHFISVLGTGLYQSTTYYYKEKSVITPFIQEALAEMLFDDIQEGDRISVFVTEKAKEQNWDNRKYTARERENAERLGHELPDAKTGLRDILQKKYGNILDDIELCMIPIGADENELWKIFQVIFSRIQEDEELYIDITHALRNIPIQMLAVISYARVLKNITVNGIYYGAFEVKDNVQNRTPIFNLQTFLDILDWSQAASSFIKYGNSDQIYELCSAQKRIYREKMSELFKLTKELNNFTHNMETSRGYYDPQKEKNTNKKEMSVLGAYKEYKKYYNLMKEDDEQKKDQEERQGSIIKPMEGLLSRIDESIADFNVDTNLEMGMATVRWAIDKKNIQQGFTAFEETIKTFLCEYYGLDERSEEDRDHICKNICRELDLNYKNKCKDKNISEIEVREAICKEWIIRKKKEGRIELSCDKKARINEMFLTIPQELFELIPKIGDRRNSMNHFGFSNLYMFTSKGLEKDLKQEFEKFVQIKLSMEEKKTHKKEGE